MDHFPPKTIETFSDNAAYSQKVIDIWAQVCEIQETFTPKDLLSNLRLLFVLSQGSTKETASYLVTIRILI